MKTLRLLLLLLCLPSLASAQIGSMRIRDGVQPGEADVLGARPATTDQGLVTRPASMTPDLTAAGTITADTQRVSLAIEGNGGASVTLTGTWTGTLTAQASYDGGTDWVSLVVWSPAGSGTLSTLTENGSFVFAGFGSATHVSVVATGAVTGTINVALRASANAGIGLFIPSGSPQEVTGTVSVTELPAGTNTIGNVLITDGTDTAQVTPTSGGSLQVECTAGCSGGGGGTQYDQGTASTATDALMMAGAIRHDTAAVDGGVADGDRVGLSTDANGRLRTTAADTTQPVSGTVTANAGSGTFGVSGTVTANAGTNLNTSALALDATVGLAQASTTASQKGPLVQGAVTTAAPSYTTAQTDPLSLQTDGSLRTAVTNTVTVNGSGVTQPVSGTVTVQQSTASNLKVDLSGTGGNATAIKVDGSAVTQPVSGSLTNISGTISLPTGASTLAEQQTQTTSLQLIDDIVHSNDAALGKVAAIGCQFDDVSPGTTTENNVRAVRCSTRREVYGQIRDAAGNERGANVTSGNALVVDGSASTQPVSGTITANAGTNLNTSALALDATVGLAQASTTASQKGPLIQGAVTTSAPSYTTAQTDPLSLQVDGSLRTAVTNTVTVSGTVTTTPPSNASTNIAQVGGSSVTTLASGEQKVGVEGLAASGASKAGNPIQAGGVFNTTQPTVTTGQAVELQATARGALIVASGTDAINVTSTASVVGNGTAATAPRVTIASDSTGQVALATGSNTIGALTANQSVNTAQIGGTAVVADPCEAIAKTTTAISQTATTKIVSKVSAKKNYICSLVIVANAAEIVSVWEGTQTTNPCDTSTTAVAGSTTAANGMSFAANGGFSSIGGKATVMTGGGTNVDVCIAQSGSSRVTGFMTWVQQ